MNHEIKSAVENQSKPSQGTLTLQRIYVKGCAFETASLTPKILKNPASPTLDLQVAVNAVDRENNSVEVVLNLQVSAKANDNILWRVQWQQAGLYVVEDIPEQQRQSIFYGFCANQLYPYASSLINQLVTQAGYPPVYLNPLNFAALYQEQLKREASQQTADVNVATVVAH